MQADCSAKEVGKCIALIISDLLKYDGTVVDGAGYEFTVMLLYITGDKHWIQPLMGRVMSAMAKWCGILSDARVAWKEDVVKSMAADRPSLADMAKRYLAGTRGKSALETLPCLGCTCPLSGRSKTPKCVAGPVCACSSRPVCRVCALRESPERTDTIDKSPGSMRKAELTAELKHRRDLSLPNGTVANGRHNCNLEDAPTVSMRADIL